jgi:T5SS/PEP-CTERM-associated repeat protein
VGNEAAAVGTVNLNGPNSQWTNTGSLSVGNAGRGTVNVTAGGHLNSGNSVIGVEMGSVGEVTVEGPNSTWNSSGLILVSSFAPGTGTLTVRDGGTVSATGGVSVRVLGTLRGDGQINGNVGNVGVVAPGTSPGALHITGNYTQGASGKLDIDLAGTTAGSQYDQLLVSGSATLAGTLDVSLIDGFTPSIGNVFEVVHANGGVLGGFPTLSLPTIPNGMGWTIVYTSVSVFLNVQSAPLIGDYNNNGTVDAADYIVWRESEGTTTSLPNDNGIGGTIGQAHYNLWRAHFGQTASSGATAGFSNSTAVPEPPSLMLLMLTAAGLYFRGELLHELERQAKHGRLGIGDE